MPSIHAAGAPPERGDHRGVHAELRVAGHRADELVARVRGGGHRGRDAADRTVATVRRVVVLGRGGAGKSTLARRLGAVRALPVLELDEHFWSPGPRPLAKDEWAAVQERLVAVDGWVMDGDLGPYDVLPVRLRAADTVLVLDFPLWRCAWRALRRSRENLDFWRWLVTYRRRALPVVVAALGEHAAHADVHVLRGPRAVERFLSRASAPAGTPPPPMRAPRPRRRRA